MSAPASRRSFIAGLAAVGATAQLICASPIAIRSAIGGLKMLDVVSLASVQGFSSESPDLVAALRWSFVPARSRDRRERWLTMFSGAASISLFEKGPWADEPRAELGFDNGAPAQPTPANHRGL